jgi:hypothetical protein
MCSAPDQDSLAPLSDSEIADQAVVQGVVRRDGEPVAGAYVRLLDSTGEFVAEVQASATGQFRFFAAPGQWTLSVLAAGGAKGRAEVSASRGEIAESEVTLAA